MSLTIANISAVLKKVIAPTIQDQLPKESVLFDKIKKNTGATVTNNQIYIAARTGRHSGIYTASEGSEPGTGKAKYQQPYTSVKYAFGTLELTDQALEAANKSDKKAIASILSTEITALKDDFRVDLNRQFFGDGTGQLTLANGTGSSSTTLTVDSTEYLAEGMAISISGSATTEISSVDSATQVTLGTARTWADNAVVIKFGSAEMMGMKGLIDDGTYVATVQNIARATNPWAKSQVDEVAEALTIADMTTQYIAAQKYGKVSVIILGPTLYAKYGNLLTATLNHAPSEKAVLGGGWQGLSFMGGNVPVVLDYNCPEGFVFGISFDAFTIAEMCDPFKWLEADAHGGILKRSASNRTVWEGTLKYYANLVCKNHRANFVLRAKTA